MLKHETSSTLSEDRPEEISRRPAIRARTGLSDATIYRLVKEGKFPQPVAIGNRAVGWRRSDIDAWLRDLCPKNKTTAS